jgi:hypothetical protein
MARWQTFILAAVLGAAIAPTGCAPHYVEPASDENNATLESLCERSLQELDALIETKATDDRFPTSALAEARALRDAAADLYLDGRSELALDLIDEAIALLENRK